MCTTREYAISFKNVFLTANQNHFRLRHQKRQNSYEILFKWFK